MTASRESLIRYLREWEHGRNVPQQPYRDLLSALYGKSFDELGIATSAPQARSDVGLIYATSLLEAVDAVAHLARFDEQRHPGVVAGHFSEEAIYAACLDWLFGNARNDLTNGAGRVVHRDVEEVVATTTMFDGLDRTFGGEHSRALAVKYLREVVIPRLHGTYDESVGRSLFQAAAVLCEVIGYMAYDDDKHSLAQRYFVQSLRFAKEASDSAYGAYVLNTMSHQALYLGRTREALRLAQVARQGYTGTHMPAVQTEAAMLEARAHAALRDATSATQALQDAERFFSLHSPDDAPNWAAHWTDVVFASFAGHGWLVSCAGNSIKI
ncbi:hypothetical protein [Saccharothrix sp.]|uniref:hypothetical protein n=1 Tax=Saccharothrix sp. TaxID=1873460 RepID=UPI0028115B31|nr:hypothetical protein [Saccharothrix sp.]